MARLQALPDEAAGNTDARLDEPSHGEGDLGAPEQVWGRVA